jgi:hypothetical protein
MREELRLDAENVVKVIGRFIGDEGKALPEKVVDSGQMSYTPNLSFKGPL